MKVSCTIPEHPLQRVRMTESTAWTHHPCRRDTLGHHSGGITMKSLPCISSSRSVDRTEEAGLAGILRNWAVEGFILGTGTDKGVYLWACYAQREPFSFSCNCCGVLAKKTDQIPIDDLCAPCRRRVDLLPAQARTMWSVTMNHRDKSSSHDISTAVNRRMIRHSRAFVCRRPWLGGLQQGCQRQLAANRRLPSPFGSLVPRREG